MINQYKTNNTIHYSISEAIGSGHKNGGGAAKGALTNAQSSGIIINQENYDGSGRGSGMGLGRGAPDGNGYFNHNNLIPHADCLNYVRNMDTARELLLLGIIKEES